MKGDRALKIIADLFEAHLFQLKKEYHKAEQIIKETVDDVFIEKILPNMSIWLWTVSEQVERTGRSELLNRYEKEIAECTNYICQNWYKPDLNIWGEDSQQIHISNLGIAYGALNAIKRVSGDFTIQKHLTQIRDYVFEHGLSGGMLIRTTEWDEVSTDLLITVMPFGLFSPEDLVLVKAVKEIENRLVTNKGVFKYRGSVYECAVSTAWLAWYFFEKGDQEKVDYYLKVMEGIKTKHAIDKRLSETIKDIVLTYMKKEIELTDDIQILHRPYGNDNPYVPLTIERIPRDPEVGQEVRVRCRIWLKSQNKKKLQVYAVIKTINRQYEVLAKEHEKDNEVLWEASLGAFDFDEIVNYWFEVRENNNTLKQSKVYTFAPYQRNYVISMEVYGFDNKGVFWLRGKDALYEKDIYLGVSKACESSQLKFSFQKPNIIKNSDHNFLKVREQQNKIVLEYMDCSFVIQKFPFRLEILNASKETILKSYNQTVIQTLQWTENIEGNILSIYWNFYSPLEERFFGLGERYHKLEYRGEKLDCYVYNQYRDQGSRTYLPVPFYISSKGYGLWLNTAYYSQFDFASCFSDLLQIRCDINQSIPTLELEIFIGKPKEIIQNYTSLTGKPVLPPVWAFGPWMSSNNWDRDHIVREQVEKTNHYKIPATVLVIEQWSDEATYYIFNDAEYEVKLGGEYFIYEDFNFPEWGRWSDPKGLIDFLHENNLKVILWQVPIQKYLNRQRHSQKDRDEEYMLQNGYHVKKHDGTPYRIPEGWFKESLLMDFSNPEGLKWWFNKRKYLLDIGVDGFKTDGGEFVFGRDLQFSDGKRGDELRNLYPNDYIGAYYNFVTEYNKGDAITFSRAGYTGVQKFPAHWAGDERSTFEAFRNSLIAGLSSGMSGIPFWGWDLAGFNGDIPTAELYIRSAQMATFCPIMQYHAESKGEYNQDRTPWNIAERTGDYRVIEGYRFYANVRMNLLPYTFAQARKSSETGIPLMRALFIEYPDDYCCYEIFDQYMFGDDLLVAPIIKEGFEERKIYFPQGEWVNLWTNEVIKGPAWKRIYSSLMDIPVFIRRGAVFITNCDESLSLGSWVGNDVKQYKKPVIRLYLNDNIREEIIDHLNNKWFIQTSKIKNQWHINISGTTKAKVAIPISLLKNDELIFINGNIKFTVNDLLDKGNYFIFEI